MRRIQLIELHEQSWFPRFLRNDVTDTLRFGLNLFKVYSLVASPLQRGLDAAEASSIVDLCSGGGGPWLDLARRIKGNAKDFHVVLTDKHPNPEAFANAQAQSEIPIRFSQSSVDAKNVPRELNGFRTIFTSFHHFPSDEARTIVQNAVDARRGIGIFEITRRKPSAIILVALWSLASLLFMPFVTPFRWSRLLCTYVIPIIPLVLLFDGVVSCLRTYRPEELREMIEQQRATEYHWEIGELRDGSFRLPVTYLIGHPQPHSPALS
jgi:Methyltransferase domain